MRTLKDKLKTWIDNLANWESDLHEYIVEVYLPQVEKNDKKTIKDIIKAYEHLEKCIDILNSVYIKINKKEK